MLMINSLMAERIKTEQSLVLNLDTPVCSVKGKGF